MCLLVLLVFQRLRLGARNKCFGSLKINAHCIHYIELRFRFQFQDHDYSHVYPVKSYRIIAH